MKTVLLVTFLCTLSKVVFSTTIVVASSSHSINATLSLNGTENMQIAASPSHSMNMMVTPSPNNSSATMMNNTVQTQASPSAGNAASAMVTQAMVTQAMVTQAMVTQAMATQAMATQMLMSTHNAGEMHTTVTPAMPAQATQVVVAKSSSVQIQGGDGGAVITVAIAPSKTTANAAASSAIVHKWSEWTNIKAMCLTTCCVATAWKDGEFNITRTCEPSKEEKKCSSGESANTTLTIPCSHTDCKNACSAGTMIKASVLVFIVSVYMALKNLL